MPWNRINAEKEKEEILEIRQEFKDYGEPARRLYQEDSEEFNRIFKKQKKQRRKWKGFRSPWEEEKETS